MAPVQAMLLQVWVSMRFTQEEISAFHAERQHMVETQIIARRIQNAEVISVMQNTPRHLFIPHIHRGDAYGDHALPIACDQTISQPYMVALMTEMLRISKDARLLEIGTGSGYQTAILAQLAATVVSIERHQSLAQEARERLDALGYVNVRILVADGSAGLPEEAPYDGVLVTAAALGYLLTYRDNCLKGASGGAGRQPEDTGTGYGYPSRRRYEWEHGMACRFVPLIGGQGWNAG